MDRKELIKRAQKLEIETRYKRRQPFFRNTMSLFKYLGLLRIKGVGEKRTKITLAETLKAAELEPRIYEMLPAILVCIPEIFEALDPYSFPDDLNQLLEDIKLRRPLGTFRGIPAEKYMHWMNSKAIEMAARRLHFRTMPRRRRNRTSSLGEYIREQRMKLCLTQKELADKIDLSVRVIRDLEQGKMTVSILNANRILKTFSSALVIG